MNSLKWIRNYALPALVILIVVTISVNMIINRDTVIPPHIKPQQTTVTIPAPVYSFPFENVTVILTCPVDSTIYFGAKAAEKETIVRGNVSNDVWLKKTYLAMINDPNQEPFYSSLINTLRSIRTKEGLDNDEYLELISVFVQSIRYETLEEKPPKFPVETFIDKSGDCDDKSLLLTGLLSREGYNVSLLSFTPESHMAVGIVCPGKEFKQTGYAFIETTNLSFVGIPADTLGNEIQLRSDPFVIRIGNGTKTYGSCNESLYLDSIYDMSEQRVEILTDEINTLKIEMDGYYIKRDAKNYNQRVPIFNDLQRKRLQYAELHNYILNHQFDRKGTYQYVKANLPM